MMYAQQYIWKSYYLTYISCLRGHIDPRGHRDDKGKNVALNIAHVDMNKS